MLAIIDLNSKLKGVAAGQTKLDSQISKALLNGYCPVARTYRVTPMDQTSLAVVLPRSYDSIASGAKYSSRAKDFSK